MPTEPSATRTIANRMLDALPETLPHRILVAMVPPLACLIAWAIADGAYTMAIAGLLLAAFLTSAPRLVARIGTNGTGHAVAGVWVAAIVLPVAVGATPSPPLALLVLLPFLASAWLDEQEALQWAAGAGAVVGLLSIRALSRGAADDAFFGLIVLVALGTATAVATAFRDALHVVATGVDPRQKSLEREYESVLEALEMALGSSARKDRFLSLMSFELRTPLTAILGYSELLSEVLEDVGTEDDVADTRAIETSSRRLLAVVDDIVDLSQIGAGTLELRDAPVDLTAVVNRALDTVRAENPTVQVSAEIARTGLIMGDHERLGRLVSNLVGQVVKGSATGERAHVLLTSRVRAVSLIVESPPDRADGEAIRRLRQGLQQPIDEKPVHLGLELTVADSLARAMGGELSVDRGARGEIRFIVTLAAKPAFATEGLRGDAA